MKISAFITHKKSEGYSDCQDRFSVNKGTKSIAVSDGMSQSYQQKIWASLLAESFTSGYLSTITEEKLDNLRDLWRQRVLDFIENLKRIPGKEYLVRMNTNSVAQMKSAAATLLGIRFDGYKWEGDVLGDSCLIELDDKNAVLAIHSSQDKEFDNYPDFFDSTTIRLKQKGQVRHISGELKAGHKILLVSDPFSDIIQDFKNGKIELSIDDLLNIKTHEEFCSLVERWRTEKGMTNDDSTLVIVTHDSTEDFNIAAVDDINTLISEEKALQETTIEVFKDEQETIPSENPISEEETKEIKHQEEDVSQAPNDAENPTDIDENKDDTQKNESEDDALELISEFLQIEGWWNRIRKKKLEKRLHRIVSKYCISKRNQ